MKTSQINPGNYLCRKLSKSIEVTNSPFGVPLNLLSEHRRNFILGHNLPNKITVFQALYGIRTKVQIGDELMDLWYNISSMMGILFSKYDKFYIVSINSESLDDPKVIDPKSIQIWGEGVGTQIDRSLTHVYIPKRTIPDYLITSKINYIFRVTLVVFYVIFILADAVILLGKFNLLIYVGLMSAILLLVRTIKRLNTYKFIE